MKKQFLFIFLLSLLLSINFVLAQKIQAESDPCDNFCTQYEEAVAGYQGAVDYETCYNYCDSQVRPECGDDSGCINDKMQDYLKQTEGNQTEENGKGLLIKNPLGSTSDIWQLIMKLIDFAFNIAIPVTAIIIVYAGYLYITSSGKPEKIQTAQKVLIWALIGFGLVLIAKSIPPFIYKFLTGKSLNTQTTNSSYSLDGETDYSSGSIQFPTSPIKGGFVYNPTTDECVWDDNATGNSPECEGDLSP